MKVIPMIFNTEMVKALLSGRKTVTRRPVNQFGEFNFVVESGQTKERYVTDENNPHKKWLKYPINIDDLIYVRETFQGPLFDADKESDYLNDRDKYKHHSHCVYAATDPKPCFFDVDADSTVSRWKPSIHMPRWASRLTLKVTDVRIEKLGQLRKNKDQVIREGFENWPQFKHVWQSIYGQSHPNDYVWVIEFEVIHQNVDKVVSAMGAVCQSK
ncbi:hypothetical protein CAY59_20920 [Vibrio campbellii]|uniref:hypothetical protein n=1 Tax=Vibrio campbellii TaxID=680 RepID=UPI000A2F9CC4|nr:hypothetical protein [Vibrio campbellii]ARR46709.1 hypothetical protein CAY59_20920 [Vibrio campbellii]